MPPFLDNLISVIRWQDILDILLISYILFRLYIILRGTRLFLVLMIIVGLLILQQIVASASMILTYTILQGIAAPGRKIASLGLRIRKGRSFHGLAFNIDMDLTPFSRINPCGFQNLRVTSLSSLVGSVDMEQVECQLLTRLAAALGYNNGFRVVAGRLPGDAG